MSIRNVILGALLLVGACGSSGGDHSIDTSRYSHACVGDSDCVGVYQGKLGCCGPDCPNTAIAQVSYDDYAATLASSTPTCNPEPPCLPIAARSCGDRSALCVGGMCTLAVTSTGSLSGASP